MSNLLKGFLLKANLFCSVFNDFYVIVSDRGGSEGEQGAAAPSEISAPVAPKKFKFATCQNFLMLGIRTESLLCISCHFNAFMFCDILMIYITY